MRHFIERTNRGRAAPMELITAYAIFSTRRQEEICQITWSDFDAETQTQMVRDMKHPGQKIGNDVRCANRQQLGGGDVVGPLRTGRHPT